MYVMLALILLQTTSSPVQLKRPIVEQSARSGATNASRHTGSREQPPSKSKDAVVPSTPTAAPEENKQQQKTAERIYKVDVISPSPKPLDTPLFPVYLLLTGIGVFVNLWIACLIYRQSRLMQHQIRTSHIATKASIRSARAAKSSADTAKQALETSERADVLLDAISFADEQNRIHPHSRPIFHFKNSGRTRAVNVRFDFWMAVPDAKDARQNDMPPITIGSQCEQPLAFSTVIESFTMQTFHDVIGGKVPLTFDGKVFYDDVFGKPHWARYSGTYHSNTRGFRVDKHETD
jgi:hypothetical protein